MNWHNLKKTKIIASIGPSTRTEEKILELYKSGVTVVRINFSHADYENTARIVEIVHRLNKEGQTKLALLGDLKGPEIRLGDYEGTKSYKKGDIFKIFVDNNATFGELDQYCDYPYLVEDLQIGHVIKIESWIFDALVKEKGSNYLLVEALNDITIKQRRHVNLPGIQIKLPGLIPQDVENVKFCMEQGFNYIAMSFVRNAAHVKELRDLLDSHEHGKNMQIISKVENQEGLDHIEEIVLASDGVMVARGDLWIEIDVSLIPLWQKKIVDLCKVNGRLVIVATQLIESMMEIPFPTRAEVSDIFNAVMQKADAVMTSGETAQGKYPVEAIQMMNKIIMQAEANIQYHYKEFTDNRYVGDVDLQRKALMRSAIEISDSLGINTIVIFTRTGKLAKIASSYRPKANIFAFTKNWNTFTNTALYFGIKSRFGDYDYHINGLEKAIQDLITRKDITLEDNVIVITDIVKGDAVYPSLQIVQAKSYIS